MWKNLPHIFFLTVRTDNNKIFILEEKVELFSACIQHLLHIARDRFLKLIIAKACIGKAHTPTQYSDVGK